MVYWKSYTAHTRGTHTLTNNEMQGEERCEQFEGNVVE